MYQYINRSRESLKNYKYRVFNLKNFWYLLAFTILFLLFFGVLTSYYSNIYSLNQDIFQSTDFDKLKSKLKDSIDLCLIDKLESKIVRYKYDVDCKQIFSLNQVKFFLLFFISSF